MWKDQNQYPYQCLLVFKKGGAFLKEKAETKKGGGLAGLKKRGENRLALGKGLAKI